MKRKFYLIAIVIAVTLLNTGCPECPTSGPSIIEIFISISDLSGNDMFDTTNVNAYDLDSIRIFRKNPTTGEVELFKPNWTDYTYGYRFFLDKKPYLVSVMLADNFSTPRTTTYIHWTPTDIDTV